MVEFTYFYSWKLVKLWGPEGSPLYGKRCRVIARAGSRKNSRLVVFEDGTQHVISGSALRKVK
jgi:hypothetical protein